MFTAQDVAQADREGAMPSDQSMRLPRSRSSCIKLTDLAITKDFDGMRPEKRRSTILAYAMDLMQAYRVDVAMTKANDSHWGEKRWRTLTARRVGYPKVNNTFLKIAARTEHRDDGRVRPAVGEGRFQNPDGGATQDIAINRDVFVWKGEGLWFPIVAAPAKDLRRRNARPHGVRRRARGPGDSTSTSTCLPLTPTPNRATLRCANTVPTSWDSAPA